MDDYSNLKKSKVVKAVISIQKTKLFQFALKMNSFQMMKI